MSFWTVGYSESYQINLSNLTRVWLVVLPGLKKIGHATYLGPHCFFKRLIVDCVLAIIIGNCGVACRGIMTHVLWRQQMGRTWLTGSGLVLPTDGLRSGFYGLEFDPFESVSKYIHHFFFFNLDLDPTKIQTNPA